MAARTTVEQRPVTAEEPSCRITQNDGLAARTGRSKSANDGAPVVPRSLSFRRECSP